MSIRTRRSKAVTDAVTAAVIGLEWKWSRYTSRESTYGWESILPTKIWDISYPGCETTSLQMIIAFGKVSSLQKINLPLAMCHAGLLFVSLKEMMVKISPGFPPCPAAAPRIVQRT